MNLKIYFPLFLSFILLLSSCSKDENQLSYENQQSQLLKKLDNFNDSLKLSYHGTRGGIIIEDDIPELLNEKWVSVVWADASGALGGWNRGSKIGLVFGPHSSAILGGCGALLCGTVGSLYKYYDEFNVPTNKNNQNIHKFIDEIIITGEIYDPIFMYKAYKYSTLLSNNTAQSKSINILYGDGSFANAQEIGESHNEIVEMVKFGTDLADIRNVQISADEEEIQLINTLEFRVEYKEEINSILNLSSSLPTTPQDKVKLAQILKRYRAALYACPDKRGDIPFIVNTYIKMIYESNELTENERAEIYPALAVGAYSGILWEPEIITR